MQGAADGSPAAAAAGAGAATNDTNNHNNNVKADNDHTGVPDMNDLTDDVSAHILYVPGSIVPKSKKYLYKLIDIRIASVDLTVDNKNVQSRKLWGGHNQLYTDDSDAVAILLHTGAALISHAAPAHTGMSAIFRILPAQATYIGSTKNGYKSRTWTSGYERCSLQLVRCSVIDGPTISTVARASSRVKSETVGSSDAAVSTKQHTAPVIHMYEVNQSRNTARNSKRRCLTDITVLYNLTNQPILKYALGLIGDRGLQESEWTAARLKREVFYFETYSNIVYELSRDNTSTTKSGKRVESSGGGATFDKYRWSLIQPSNKVDTHVPAGKEYAQIIADGLDFDEIEWSTDFVVIRGVQYPLHKFTSKPITH